MNTPQQDRTERARKIAASAARVSLQGELEEWRDGRNAILREVAAAELSRRRDLQSQSGKKP